MKLYHKSPLGQIREINEEQKERLILHYRKYATAIKESEFDEFIKTRIFESDEDLTNEKRL